MPKNKEQVIKIYRDRLRDLAALGLHQYVNNIYFYTIIAKETGYTPESARKILEAHKKSSSWRFYIKFLDTIPCVFDKVKSAITHHMINSRLTR